MAQLESTLSLRQLRYFLAIVEHHSFSAAARALHVAQPSLSRQVALLEAALDEHLLVRHAEGVSVTDAGSRLYSLARDVLERVNGAQTEIRGQTREPEGRVSIVVPAVVGNELMAALVKVCKKELPRVGLEVIDGFSSPNAHLLASGLADLGVVPNAEEIPGLHYEPLFTEHIYLVRSDVEDISSAPEQVSFADACAAPLVLGPRNSHLRGYLEHMAASQGVRLNLVYEQNSVGVMAAFVRSGLAATLSNWPGVVDYMPLGTALVQRVVDPPLGRVISLGHPAARPLNHASQAVYRIVRRLLLERLHSGQWRGVPA